MVLMAKQHMYMEMPAKMMESRGMFHFFKYGDAENSCGEWLAPKIKAAPVTRWVTRM